MRRRRASGSAAGLGTRPAASSLARTKASIGPLTQALFFTSGGVTALSGR